MSKAIWPTGRDNPNCICGEIPNVNCEVHVTKFPQPPPEVSKAIDERPEQEIIGLIKFVLNYQDDFKAIRLKQKAATSAIEKLILEARLEEHKILMANIGSEYAAAIHGLKKNPNPKLISKAIKDRLTQLRKNIGSDDELS